MIYIFTLFHRISSMLYVVMSSYIDEMSPKDSRCMMVSLLGPAYNTGKIAALITNIGFSSSLLAGD